MIILLLQIYCYAQLPDTDNCSLNSRYKIEYNNGNYPEIKIEMKGEWKNFEILDERALDFNYICLEVELDGEDSKELVIEWSNAIYGSGGGSTIKGIQIWDLNNGIKLLNEVVSCSIESFGRFDNKPYLIECEKVIEILDHKIIVNQKHCKISRTDVDNVPDPALNCQLTALEEGRYFFANGELKKK